MKKLLSIIFVIAIAAAMNAQERRGMIICARSGNQSLLDENRKYTLQTLELFKKSGIGHVQCFIEGGGKTVADASPATAGEISGALKKLSSDLKPADEFWLFIYGYANQAGKKYSIATDGGRMSGSELAGLIKKIPSKKNIFCFNIQSYPLLELLRDKDCFVMSATSDANQLNPPLLPGYLLGKWIAEPEKPFNETLGAATRELNDYFQKNSMAAAESPVIADGDELYKYPFETAIRPIKPGSVIGGGKTQIAAAVPAEKAETASPEVMPADAGTLKALENARLAAREYPECHALCLNAETECTINNDSAAKTIEKTGIFINSPAGADQFSRLSFQDAPPHSEFRLLKAAIIYPDGKSRGIKADVFPNKSGGAFYALKFPGISPGCIIELETEHNFRNAANTPFFQRGFTVQQSIPVNEYVLKFRTPLKQDIFFRTVNGSAEKLESKESYSKVTEFRFKKIPPFEALPYDPPADEILARVMVSYDKSWEQFDKWSAAMFEGTEKLDDKTAGMVKTLCAGAASNAAKVKAVYEFLCNLRYDSTPSGARAFRPRFPAEVCRDGCGDCKDKANALVAMAAQAGVKGYVALVKRGGRVIPDFPSWQFNHAVAYFPELDGFPDGLWCDPTDTSTPFGTLPPGDAGCDAWIMNGKGGEFRKIQTHDKKQNFLRQDIVFNVSKDDQFTGRITYAAKGLMDYLLRMKFKGLSPLQKKNMAQEMVNKCFTGAYVNSVEHAAGDSLAEPFALKIEIGGDFWPLVRDNIQPPFDFWSPFSFKNRNRPLYLNDGQPFKVAQTVKVNGAGLNGKGGWQDAAGPLRLKCSYEENNTKRTVEADVTDSLIAPAVYEQCRPLIRMWYSKL